MKIKVYAVAVVGFVLASMLLAAQQYDWDKAKREIKRLVPSTFKELPAEIIKKLEARGCTIPQSFGTRKPHNVVQGEFARKGQTDWAILCSKNEESTILLFWRKPTQCPTELATLKDEIFLQHLGGTRIGYSRMIGTAGADFILEHYRLYGGPKPPPLDHQGINDMFLEKASDVFYCHQGKWLQLTGAD